MDLNIPDKEYDGFVFDCDGTLVHSMPLHYEAWLAALRVHGAPYELSPERFFSLGGTTSHEIIAILNEEHGTSLDPIEVKDTKVGRFLELIEERLEPIDAVVALARGWHGKKPMSVASGGDRRVVERCLEHVGIGGLFDDIFSPADVERGKPAPDMFLLAAERMGVSPARCLVFEDAPPGYMAAEAAGMDCVMVPWRDLPIPDPQTT